MKGEVWKCRWWGGDESLATVFLVIFCLAVDSDTFGSNYFVTRDGSVYVMCEA